MLAPLGSVIGNILLTEGLGNSDDAMEFDSDEKRDTLVVHVMKYDRALWKAARMNFHQMFMATVLMHSEQKQEFTRELVRNYRKIFLDFIDDDHEHSVSITALTVQVFTVPTLARMLIAEESALEVIMNVLVDFCQRYLKEPEKKRFDFSPKSFPNVLRRAMFMMNDFKYLLTVVPSETEWTLLLQNKFYNGCMVFIRFLSYLQGMDEVKRQSGEHQTWELEWETAFNIHLRLQSTITMVIAWITSHKDVHARLFRYVLQQLCDVIESCEEFHGKVKVEVNGISAMCIPFDVMRDKISVHQPLWRLMAGLFAAPTEFIQHAISRCAGENTVDNFQGKRAMLYEMPMRVLVLCAQCHAQMWRRNGFSLVNQVHNYFSPLCRSEMFDRDILMMQVGAAISAPDVFLIRMLHRFALHHWAEFGFEEQEVVLPSQSTSHEELSKCTVTLAEEMLHYIISIIEERYLPGVGKSTREDALRREVLHILAAGPKPFSKIDREVPDCPLISEVSLDEVVKAICEFRKPTKTSAGVFYLKKSVWKEYSPFFYHYSKTHISQAEQFQLKERAGCERSILACPPPEAPQFEPFFAPVRNLLLSPVLVRILRIILERVAKRSRYSSDGLLHRALYIIGLGLNEQAADEKFDFIKEAEKEGLLCLMELLDGKVEASLNAHLLGYVIQQYQTAKTKVDVSLLVRKEEKDAVTDSAKKSRRAAMAAKMRKQAMDQMNRMQKQFLTMNKSLLDKEAKLESEGGSSMHVIEDEEPVGVVANDSGFPVCLGTNRLSAVVMEYRRLTCILCQETEVVKYNGRPLVCVGFIQQSSLFAQKGDSFISTPVTFISAHIPVGIDVSTCGHTMHFDCYQHYSELLKARERGRPRQALGLTQRHIDIESGEYLCPLCKRLSNAAIPLLPALSFLNVKRCENHDDAIGSFDVWVKTLEKLVNQPSASSKSVKAHSRKRSHSERFTITRGSQPYDTEIASENSFSSSVPSVNAMPLDTVAEAFPDIIEVNGVPTALMVSSLSNAEEEMEQNEQRSLAEVRLLAMLPFSPFPNFVHKIREMMGHPKQLLDNVPKSLMVWEMVKCFLRAANTIRKADELTTVFGQNGLETITAWQMTAFTLRSIAVVLRRENKPLFGALNARQRECLYAISRISAIAAFNCRPQSLRLILRALLEPFFDLEETVEQNETWDNRPSVSSVNSFNLTSMPFSVQSASVPSSPIASSPSTSSSKLLFIVPGSSQLANSASTPEQHSAVKILCIDMLSFAIELAVCIGWSWIDERMVLHDNDVTESYVLPSGSLQEHYAIRLALLGHVYQILATFDRCDTSEILNYPASWVQSHEKFDSAILKLLKIVRGEEFVCDFGVLRQALFVGIVEFLRPLALFFHALTLVPPPEALKAPSYDEFQPLCRYLGFPSDIADLFSSSCVDRLFSFWKSQNTVQQDGVTVINPVRQPVIENSLIELPEDFSELINTAANFRCPTSLLDDHVSSMPTLCLICGSLLCSQSYCCQRVVNRETRGACSCHLQTCSGPSGGIFLRIRDCQIILLTTRARGCFLPAPYVDEFGETDFGFRRGNPLHLNKELYAKLERIWLHQSISEEVVNQNEIDNRNRNEWQHF